MCVSVAWSQHSERVQEGSPDGQNRGRGEYGQKEDVGQAMVLRWLQLSSLFLVIVDVVVDLFSTDLFVRFGNGCTDALATSERIRGIKGR